MPIRQKINGEWCGDYGTEASWAAQAERGLFKDLLAVQSEIENLIEYATEAAREGKRYEMDADLRQQLTQTASKIPDLMEILPKPRLEAVK